MKREFKMLSSGMGLIIVDKRNSDKEIKEKFKSEVNDIFIRFPKELGVAHPFKFEDVEKLYKKTGIVYGTINKYVHAIIGEFSIKTKNPKATKILKDFVKKA